MTHIRPMSCKEGPHAGEMVQLAEHEVLPPDLSIDHESAEEHLSNAQQLLRCADFLTGEPHRVTIEAAHDRIAMAVRAIAERRLVPRSARAEMAVLG
jgi:hypothetical protein